ncbi:MAG TPA: AraD1 family protein [Edaphobacter sp.]|uniref:AraD1 family protein n=1 Tax=Edaphobacter sp. TaxID=1934404 RepID=UPI002CD691D4|nr:AraD1 family protein [Edaphobacter sp.]HUZ95414.1 AraD1 family protein [Edaphobacter sp.]
MIRLVQISNGDSRRVALVEEPNLRCLIGVESIYELVRQCLLHGDTLSKQAVALAHGEVLQYDSVYDGSSDWHLLPPIDVPDAPSRLTISGTGLTHLGSAKERQAMHAADTQKLSEAMTDSMRMFQWGVEGGRPSPGEIGIAPEWFYKGNGSMLKAPFASLSIPAHAEDGGEEAELAGIYIVGEDGAPYRIGLTAGNEFSDHSFEKRNYLNLAGSKLRNCSLGPELLIGGSFQSIAGEVRIEREAKTIWSKGIVTGEENMCHSLANLEHHHFKFEGHRQPGDVHVHFFGAHSLSFGDGIVLQDGDWMEVHFEGFGRPLRNPVRVEKTDEKKLITAHPLA